MRLATDSTGADRRSGPPEAPRPAIPPGGSVTSRPHWAARSEDAVNRWVAARLRARGWTERVEPYAGYGAAPTEAAAGWVRVLARVVLAPAAVTQGDLPGAGAANGPGARAAQTPVRGWRSFATAQVPSAVVEAEVDGRWLRVVCDRGGYLDAVLPVALTPGWHDVRLRTADGAERAAPVVVVGAGTTGGIVSDIDDTVMVTRLPRPLIAAWNSFVRHENAREPVPGMAELYRAMRDGRPDAPVVYLSTGAWNAAPAISRFLDRHGLPAGPLLLTDWGPTNTGWFRSGPAHKAEQLDRLARELPQVRWVLVGDDGQHDPALYARAARLHPDQTAAVLIRRLTGGEHVLAHGSPVAPGERGATGGAGVVPVLVGADGTALLREWRLRGLALG